MNSAKVMLVVAAAGSALVTIVGLCVVAGSLGTANGPSGMLAGSVCATSGPLPGLSKAAAANARTVAATALARGGRQAALIALMTGLTESGLRVLTNPNDPAGNLYPSQGVGYDHDSLGIFQQRPSWGSAAQRMDPVVSTGLFLDRLLALPEWRVGQPVAGSPSRAGLGVRRWQQLPGQPGPRRSAPARHHRRPRRRPTAAAQESVTRPLGRAALTAFRSTSGCPLRPRVRRPRRCTSPWRQLGDPYAWGAEGPNAYDCSGLMQAAWKAAGVPLTRTTSTQVHDGRPTTPGSLSPGDLVFIPGYDGTLASPGHVGMFIGHGLVVEAPKTGDVVKVVSYDSFVSDGLAQIRHID